LFAQVIADLDGLSFLWVANNDVGHIASFVRPPTLAQLGQ
jgi:hypothetical protein